MAVQRPSAMICRRCARWYRMASAFRGGVIALSHIIAAMDTRITRCCHLAITVRNENATGERLVAACRRRTINTARLADVTTATPAETRPAAAKSDSANPVSELPMRIAAAALTVVP